MSVRRKSYVRRRANLPVRRAAVGTSILVCGLGVAPALALAVAACGSTHGATGAADAAADAPSGSSDAGPTVLDTGSVVLDGGVVEPVEAAAEDAPEAASNPCLPLGAACVPGAGTCYCSLGSGCTFDNADCPDSGPQAGTCTADPGEILLDAGEACCSQCQYAYDTCGAGASCFDAWTACNASCGEGLCPVQCYAALVP